MKNKKILIPIIILFIAIISGGTYTLMSRNESTNQHETISQPTNTVDYDGPTKEEQAANNKSKSNNDTELNSKNEKIILISDAAQYESTVEVRAYIPSVLEPAGMCTATFYQDSKQIVSIEQMAFIDMTTTQCGALDAPRSQFPLAGLYQLVVRYSSDSYSGKSDQVNIRVY